MKASTLHRLLGWKPGNHSRFRHDHDNRLPYDVVVVDECSMVPLTLMSRLLEAVRPGARLVLVGDPDQLASVEAGAVLGDLVGRLPVEGAVVPEGLADETPDDLRNGVVRLTHRFRYGDAIGDLADAVRDGEVERVLDRLREGGDHIEFVETASVEGLRPTGPGSVAQRGCRRSEPGVRRRRGGGHHARPGRARHATGCCARTAAARTAWPAGRPRSSAGSRPRMTSAIRRRGSGTSAGRCW